MRADSLRQILLMLAGFALVLAWLSPNHYLPWPAFRNEALAIFALLLAALAMLERRPGIPLIVIPVLALAPVPLLQWRLGVIVFYGEALVATYYLLLLGLSIWLGYALWQRYREASLEGLAWSILAGAFISAFIALAQWAGRSGVWLGVWAADLPPNGKPFANLGHHNLLNTLEMLGICSLLYLRSRDRLSGFSMSWLLVPLLLALVVAQSRTGWLAMAWLLVWRFCKPQVNAGISRNGLLMLIAAFAALTLVYPSVTNLLRVAGESGMSLRSPEPGVRLLVWQQLLDAAWAKPWIGWGWNQVSLALVSTAQDYPPTEYIGHSHNLLIDLLVWNGVVLGSVLVLALVIWLARHAWRTTTSEAWFAGAFIGCIAVHALLEFPAEYAFFLFPVGLLAGTLTALHGGRMWTRAALPLLAVLLTGLSVTGLGIAREYITAEHAHRATRFAAAKYGHNTIGQYPRPASPQLTQLWALQDFMQLQAQRGMSETQLREMERVVHHFPMPPALFRYALALTLNDRPREADLELDRLEKLHPQRHIIEAQQALDAMRDQEPRVCALRRVICSTEAEPTRP